VDGDAPDVLALELDLTGVHPDADVEAEIPYRHGAPDGSRRSVESREESVARRIDLAATVSSQQSPDPLVVGGKELSPGPIAELGSALGRAHDVRERHRREHSVSSRRRTSDCHELLDLIDDRVAAPDERDVVHAGKLHEDRALDLVGHVSHLSRGDDPVSLATDHERRHMDRGQRLAEVDVGEDAGEITDGTSR